MLICQSAIANRVRAYVCAVTLTVIHAPIPVECLFSMTLLPGRSPPASRLWTRCSSSPPGHERDFSVFFSAALQGVAMVVRVFSVVLSQARYESLRIWSYEL